MRRRQGQGNSRPGVRGWAGMCALLGCLLLGAPHYAGAGSGQAGPVTIDCPDEVPRGQAFVLRLSSPGEVAPVRVRWLGREVVAALLPAPEGFAAELLLGWGLRLQDPVNTLELEVDSGQGVLRFAKAVAVQAREFPEERLTVERRFTALSEEDLARSERERALVRATLRVVSPDRRWTLPFVRPCAGPVTSVFGLRRFFNGEERSPHGGADLDGETGDSIAACAAGRVALAGEHFFSGNTVYLDHGQGVISMYCHLSRILVSQGDTVEAGQEIGLMGATGRVTGSHLHFGLFVLGQNVDPLPLCAPD